MTDPKSTGNQSNEETIHFAELSGGVVVIRVVGRGSFANSPELKKISEHMAQKLGAGGYHFVVDLAECQTMDSTFMGVLASIGLRQKRDNGEKMVVVNANEQSGRLMQTLGLSHFVTIRSEGEQSALKLDQGQIQAVAHEEVSKREHIIHMIEAHENLCEIDSENCVRFEGVLKFLHDSLEREKGAK